MSYLLHFLNLLLHLLKLDDPPDWVNVGCGKDISIRELAELVISVVGFEGEIIQDTSMPDGNPKKLMDVSRMLSTGWSPSISLQDGITRTYEEFLKQLAGGELRDSR